MSDQGPWRRPRQEGFITGRTAGPGLPGLGGRVPVTVIMRAAVITPACGVFPAARPQVNKAVCASFLLRPREAGLRSQRGKQGLGDASELLPSPLQQRRGERVQSRLCVLF